MSPELWKGCCCICCGTLTPENTLVEDLYEGRGGVHRGVCAILAGIVPEEHLATHDALIRVIHAAPRGEERDRVMKRYYEWVHSIAEEDHYDHIGPVGV